MIPLNGWPDRRDKRRAARVSSARHQVQPPRRSFSCQPPGEQENYRRVLTGTRAKSSSDVSGTLPAEDGRSHLDIMALRVAAGYRRAGNASSWVCTRGYDRVRPWSVAKARLRPGKCADPTGVVRWACSIECGLLSAHLERSFDAGRRWERTSGDWLRPDAGRGDGVSETRSVTAHDSLSRVCGTRACDSSSSTDVQTRLRARRGGRVHLRRR